MTNEPKPVSEEIFDYVIVGAGAAGSELFALTAQELLDMAGAVGDNAIIGGSRPARGVARNSGLQEKWTYSTM